MGDAHLASLADFRFHPTPLESVTIQMKATEQYVSCGTVHYAVQGGSNFGHGDEILKCDHSSVSY